MARLVPDQVLYTQARGQLGAALVALRAAGSPTAKLDAVTTVLRITGTMAANAPTPDLAARWLVQYRVLQPQAAQLRGQVSDGAPGAVLRSLDKLSDAVLTFGGQVLEGAGGLAAAAPKVLAAAPWLLALALVAVAVVAVKVGPQLVGRRK